MSVIKSLSVGNGDMFYIKHNSDNFTVIDCNLSEENKEVIMNEICEQSKNVGITRFISTHPDEDHFHGIEYFDERLKICNFYCVKNEATKSEETVSFKKYCELRDNSQIAFNIFKGCSRNWMNKTTDERGSSGISILWPDTENEEFKNQLSEVKKGNNANNISPIIKYALESGVRVLWFGDLETDFMETIIDDVSLPKADIVFAPHHGRNSGKIPSKWLSDISPTVIIIGEADSTDLNYYSGYNTITQLSAGNIVFDCSENEVDVYVSKENYTPTKSFLVDKKRTNCSLGHYIGSFETNGD